MCVCACSYVVCCVLCCALTCLQERAHAHVCVRACGLVGKFGGLCARMQAGCGACSCAHASTASMQTDQGNARAARCADQAAQAALSSQSLCVLPGQRGALPPRKGAQVQGDVQHRQQLAWAAAPRGSTACSGAREQRNVPSSTLGCAAPSAACRGSSTTGKHRADKVQHQSSL